MLQSIYKFILWFFLHLTGYDSHKMFINFNVTESGLVCTISTDTTWWQRKYHVVPKHLYDDAANAYATETCEQLATKEGEIIYNHRQGIFKEAYIKRHGGI